MVEVLLLLYSPKKYLVSQHNRRKETEGDGAAAFFRNIFFAEEKRSRRGVSSPAFRERNGEFPWSRSFVATRIALKRGGAGEDNDRAALRLLNDREPLLLPY